MVGKTNLTFISKDEASSVQLVQNSFVTDATGEIYKMEVINNKFFAFVGSKDEKKNILMGTDAGNMSFVRKGNELLEATHIIYAEGNYYLVKSENTCAEIYKTGDFNEYEQVDLFGIEGKWFGIFLDSREKVVLVSYTPSGNTTIADKLNIYVADSLKDNANVQVSTSRISPDYEDDFYNTCLVNNKIIFLHGKQIGLNGEMMDPANTQTGMRRYNYAEGYFFHIEYNGDRNYYCYRSRDSKNLTRYPYSLNEINISSVTNAYVVPISGKCCLLYRSKDSKYYANIADDILRVGHQDNMMIEMVDEPVICSVVEADGKTYVETTKGIIYEFQLDYEGIIKRPDVTIIKTLAAKQALAQSVQYTDDCIAKLKNYIDSKVQEELSTLKNNSINVESGNNGD